MMPTGRLHLAGFGGVGGTGKGRLRTERLVVHLVLVVYATVAAVPLLIVFGNSFRATSDIVTEPVAMPDSPSLSNYATAWSDAHMSTYIINSFVITASAVVLCCVVSVLAAYSLARFTFRGRGLLTAFFLSGLTLPFQLAAVPVYHLFNDLGLIDNRLAVVLVYAATGTPLAIFILSAFFRQLPDELSDAARIDGAGELRVFGSVMLPLVRPALATVASITFVLQWNDFFFPLVLLRSESKFTVTVGLTAFFGQYSNDIGPLLAGLVLAMLPLLLLFILAFRQIISGLLIGVGK